MTEVVPKECICTKTYVLEIMFIYYIIATANILKPNYMQDAGCKPWCQSPTLCMHPSNSTNSL